MIFGDKASSGRPTPFASILYAEPGALGLMCNILSALTVAIANVQDVSENNFSSIISGTHLILVGGILQLLSGFLSFRRNDHLTGTAFTVFAALWSNLGIVNILSATNSNKDLAESILPGFVGFMIIAVILFVCSLFVNYIMPPVLAAMTLTLIFECIGQFYRWGKRVAAAFEFIIVVSAVYAVVVMTTKGVSQRYILPGFGNAPIDPLLIKTRSVGKKKHEKKKNTKYAEPMGMGYIGNIIPSVILCFYHFHYIKDIRPAIPAMLASLFCHILSSYYAYLRKDSYNTFQFVIYFIFWVCKAAAPFLKAIGVDNLNNSATSYFGLWGLVLVMLVQSIISASQNLILFIYNIILTVTMVLSLEHIPESISDYTFGVASCIVAVTTIYVAIASLLNSIAEKPIVYVGPEVIPSEKLLRLFSSCRRENRSMDESTEMEETNFKVDILSVDGLIFMANCVASFGLSPADVTGIESTIAIVFAAGVIVNLFSARLAYAGGSLARSFIAIVLALVWTTWISTAFNDINITVTRAASVSVLSLQVISIVISCTFSKVWMITSLFILVNTIACVLTVFDVDVTYMILVTSLLVGISCFYGTFHVLYNTAVGKNVIPNGKPILQYKEPEKLPLPCPVFASRKASDLLACAKLLDEGVVVGIPTDTVYALGASCKHPESINAIYHIKGRPPEKPICLCISSLNQLKTANPPFSPLLWKFMDLCYPGGITCTVRKGEWLRHLGVGDSIDYIGKKDSVAIRVPDSSVLSYLVSVSGPIALTSANPSGEPDSLHHDMVLSGLGHKLAGVVCDDESNELKPSTVVNCLDIDKGVISYFRIGCVPQQKVDALFEQAKEELSVP